MEDQAARLIRDRCLCPYLLENPDLIKDVALLLEKAVDDNMDFDFDNLGPLALDHGINFDFILFGMRGTCFGDYLASYVIEDLEDDIYGIVKEEVEFRNLRKHP